MLLTPCLTAEFCLCVSLTDKWQTPYYWPSQNHSPENSEYVIYLYKRSLRNKQKHGLEEYELVNTVSACYRPLFDPVFVRGGENRTIQHTHSLLFSFFLYLLLLLLLPAPQEALNRLKRQMAHKWEFIVMQAEEQVFHPISTFIRVNASLVL